MIITIIVMVINSFRSINWNSIWSWQNLN